MAKINYTKQQLEKMSVEELRSVTKVNFGKRKANFAKANIGEGTCDCQGDQNCMPGYYCKTGNCSGKNSLAGVCVEDFTGLSGLKETWYGSVMGGSRTNSFEGLLCDKASPPLHNSENCNGIADCCPGIERGCACACHNPKVCQENTSMEST